MTDKILEVNNLLKHYRSGGLFSFGQKSDDVPAVDDISFHVSHNETLGLVGESGCGKTTTGKAIVRLVPATSGNIIYNGTDITRMPESEFRPYRKDIQMIFQDLDAALNPKMRIKDILKETIKLHNKGITNSDIVAKSNHLLELVSLSKNKLESYPRELSGGEKRRIGVARVLAVKPKLIVADEPTSGLDVSVQAQIVNLLKDLQKDFGLSFIFISHDLHLVELLSHRIAVMYLGKIVEIGPAKNIISAPQHPYTEILWSSLKSQATKEVDNHQAQTSNWGVYDFARPTTGCRFATRCPIFKSKGNPEICASTEHVPQLNEIGENHRVACHFPLSKL